MRSVLHLAPELFGPGAMGGGERYVEQLARAQRVRGLRTTVVAAMDGTSMTLRTDDGSIRSISRAQLLELAREHHVLHVHQYKMQVFEVAESLQKSLGKPLFLTDHGGTRRYLGRLRGTRRLDCVTRFLPVTPWSARDVDAHHRAGEPVVLWGGGDHLPRAEHTLPDHTDFLFVGRLLPHKGVHVLLRALPSGATLRIVGESRDPQYRDHLQDLARGKAVDFAGAPTDSALSSFYRASTFTVLPSVKRFGRHRYPRPELLGLVMLESMAAGVRTIGSSVGGLAEVLHRAGQTSVRAGDVDAWRSTLETRLTDPGPLPDAAFFTWDACARRAMAGYASAA